MSDAELEHWHGAWSALGLAEPPGLLERLLAAYAEPQRAYHTQQHLRECFEQLEPAAALAEHLPDVQLALWFHDAVYDPRAQDNESRSADWARRALASAGVHATRADRIHALVMATRHAAVPEGADAELLVDVDLSILAAPAQRFDEYERQIRVEYAWVPEAAFRQGRANVLRGFLARPRIFASDAFAPHAEPRARANLTRSLAALGYHEPTPREHA